MSDEPDQPPKDLGAEIVELRRQIIELQKQLDYKAGEAAALRAIMENGRPGRSPRTPPATHPPGSA